MSYFHIFKLIAADNSRNTETVADNADRGTEDDDDTTDTDYNPELTIITKYNHQHSSTLPTVDLAALFCFQLWKVATMCIQQKKSDNFPLNFFGIF